MGVDTLEGVLLAAALVGMVLAVRGAVALEGAVDAVTVVTPLMSSEQMLGNVTKN